MRFIEPGREGLPVSMDDAADGGLVAAAEELECTAEVSGAGRGRAGDRMVMTWKSSGERALVMELAAGGADWIEVRANGKGPLPQSGWAVHARLGGSHYRLGDVFPTQEVAQGCALLLAIRLLPIHRREALHAALDEVPNAWWWKIARDHDASGEHSIISSRLAESAEAAERTGRAAGGGWWLTVYGPGGSVRECGLVVR